MIYFGVVVNGNIITKGAQNREINEGQIELTKEQFDVIQTPCNLDFEPITLPVIPPTEEELNAQYQSLTVEKIRLQYTQDDENRQVRKMLAYQDDETIQAEFTAYNDYVVQCKAEAREEVYGIDEVE